MSSIALVRNPYSTRNRRASEAALRALPRHVRVIDCAELGELTDRLREAHGEGAQTLIVDGGDGTLREVLSRLPDIWGSSLPQIGILPRGNTNLIARQAGALPSPDAVGEVLRRCMSGSPLRRRPLRMMRVEYPGGEHPTMRGFLLGWGAYETATRIAREEIRLTGRTQVPLAIAATVRRVLLGTQSRQMREGIEATLRVDDGETLRGKRLIGVATSLQGRLLPCINPFWGDGSGPIRWLDVDAPGQRLLLALPFTLAGRPRRWMEDAGYRSGRAHRIELEISGPLILDGDTFPRPAAGPLVVTADEEVSFISL